MRELCSNQTNSILHGRLKQRAEHIARTQDIAGIMFLGKNARLKLIIKQKYLNIWRKKHTAKKQAEHKWKILVRWRMKGRCTWNKFLNRTTQHWGRSDQFACDTFCSSCEKTRHTGDFPRFHFETVHKLFSITVIPLFSQTYHSGQCHDSTQIESFNLLCSSKPF